MSYIKAENILPQELIWQIQEYADGVCIYIPRKPGTRHCWGQETPYKAELKTRNDRWLELYRQILEGYDSVAKLTEDERKAAAYIVLANQFVCVAWFSEQDKYAEIFEVNKKMTTWMIEKLEELKAI